ncbi:MAG: ABC transporter permease [Desulfobacterales bacterium]|nr:MAG: ABC transporter permease [Desulfobacterales bacterium]
MDRTGSWAIGLGLDLLGFTSTGVAVIVQGCRPLTWRRTVRAEFLRHLYLVGIRSLALTVLVGALIGLGLVFQALYWLQLFGESGLIGKFLVLVVLRELAPMILGLIVLGRSGSIMLVELGSMKAQGQVRTLDAMGLNPFLFFIVPRVLATSLSTFCLTVAFCTVALATGFIAGHALNLSQVSVIEFLDRLLEAMGPSEFAILLLKPLLMGFAVALISCTTGLMVTGSVTDVPNSLPGGFVRAVVAIFLISGLFSILL